MLNDTPLRLNPKEERWYLTFASPKRFPRWGSAYGGLSMVVVEMGYDGWDRPRGLPGWAGA